RSAAKLLHRTQGGRSQSEITARSSRSTISVIRAETIPDSVLAGADPFDDRAVRVANLTLNLLAGFLPASARCEQILYFHATHTRTGPEEHRCGPELP